MNAEFINRPTSGQFLEKHFGEIIPDCSWVKFVDNDFEEWVGSFAQGWSGFLTSILNACDNNISFVIVGGNGYLIEVSNREQLNIESLSAIETAILDNENKRILYSNGLNILSVDFAGNRSVFYDKYFFDEIEFLEIKENKLYAQYWYHQKSSEKFFFEIDLSTKEIKDTFVGESI